MPVPTRRLINAVCQRALEAIVVVSRQVALAAVAVMREAEFAAPSIPTWSLSRRAVGLHPRGVGQVAVLQANVGAGFLDQQPLVGAARGVDGKGRPYAGGVLGPECRAGAGDGDRRYRGATRRRR